MVVDFSTQKRLSFLDMASSGRAWPRAHGFRAWTVVMTHLRYALLMRSSVEGGPVDLAGILALEEEGLGLAVLEAKDLAVATDVELSLQMPLASNCPSATAAPPSHRLPRLCLGKCAGPRDATSGGRRDAPCPGRSSGR